MDMASKEIIEFLHSTARSVGAEVTSPWFYLQFGLILAAAGIAYAADAAIRARVDMTSLAMRWPLPLRHFARVLVGSASTAVFAILVIAARVTMYHTTWPSRSYLLMVAAKLALAWLVIRLVTSVIRNAFIVKLVSVSAWLVAALSILGQLDPAAETLEFVCDRDRRLAADAAAADQGRRAADRGAVADQHRQQFRRKPDQPRQRPDAVDPGAAGQDHPHRADGGGDRDRARRRRHQPVGAGGVHRRGRRRHRSRPAEDRRQFHLGHHPAGGQIGEARRPRHHRRQFGPDQRDEDALYLGRRRRRPRVPDPERGSGDAEGRELDLYRQEHAGEGRCSAPITTPIRGWSASSRSRSPPPRRAPSRTSRRTAS